MTNKVGVPHTASISVELHKEAVAQVTEFKGVMYLSLRCMFELPNGEMAFSKNGINVPIEFGRAAIEALIAVYDESTGSTLQLTGIDSLEPGQ